MLPITVSTPLLDYLYLFTAVGRQKRIRKTDNDW
jgi:hypothetical protein